MPRAFLVVMDSVGCGGAPDAAAFFNDGTPDTGANTLAHIAQACAAGRAEHGRTGPLRLPNLDALGLGAAIRLASGDDTPGLDMAPGGLWGAATEVSKGKDTPSGHWELAGVPVPWDWHYFPKTEPCFPPDLTAEVCRLAGHGRHPRQPPRLGHRHHRRGGRRPTSAPAGPSATPPPTASSRSPRTRRRSASTASSPSANASRPHSTP